jgi:hypothetical protein
VRFELSQEDYARACDAHRDHRFVAVTGILQRDPKAKMFDLVHPQGFQILGVQASAS